MWWEISEAFATTFNISSNLFMFLYMLKDTEQKVPSSVIYLQICGNVSWIISSLIRRDPYLCTTSTSSLLFQMSTAFILRTKSKVSQKQKLSNSTDELPTYYYDG